MSRQSISRTAFVGGVINERCMQVIAERKFMAVLLVLLLASVHAAQARQQNSSSSSNSAAVTASSAGSAAADTSMPYWPGKTKIRVCISEYTTSAYHMSACGSFIR